MVEAQTVENKAPARSRRFLALGLALAGAFMFALAVQSSWWTAGEVSMGPFGSRHCFGGECRESGLGWLGGSDLWMRSGVAARAGGYIAMFFLIVLAGGHAARRIPRLMARAAIVSILTAVVTGAYFAATFPGVPGAVVSRGLVMFPLAIVIGVLAAVTTLRMPVETR
jgi:hypothetical protein